MSNPINTQIPLVGFGSNLHIYNPDYDLHPLLYNYICADGKYISRPGFEQLNRLPLEPTETEILHIGIENDILIICTNQFIHILNKNTFVQELNKVAFTQTISSVDGTHYLNRYVLTTDIDGFYVISAPINGTPSIVHTTSVTAPIPYSAAGKVLGARVISTYGSLLLIGGLTIKPDNNKPEIIQEESYILWSQVAQSPTPTGKLPVAIDDTTFNTTFPIVLASAGKITEMKFFGSQLLVSFSTGESYSLSGVQTTLGAPFSTKKISTSLGAFSPNCSVILDSECYTLAHETIAITSAGSQVERVGDHLRDFIRNRFPYPVFSFVSTEYQSIFWLISSKATKRCPNQILLFNYLTQDASIIGVEPTVTILGMVKDINRPLFFLKKEQGNDLIISTFNQQSGVDKIDPDTPIRTTAFLVTSSEGQVQMSGSTIDPYRVQVILSTSDKEIPITSQTKIYTSTILDPDLWPDLSKKTQLSLRNLGVNGTHSYTSSILEPNHSGGTILVLDTKHTARHTLELITVQQTISV